jgi:glycosyltransferase involved in cell wall biosynthesis
VLPEGIDDPARPSGGNGYDRRICRGLAALGWHVHEHAVPGSWPQPDLAAQQTLARTVAGIPPGCTVLVDGLIASTAPAILVPEARRLRLVVLVHMPLGRSSGRPEAPERERAVLSAADLVVTTSFWTQAWLLDRYQLPPEAVCVVQPGVEPAEVAVGTAAGANLLCVAAVVADKGHDQLLAALAGIAELPWHCTCVGALDRDRAFVQRLHQQAATERIGDRVCFAGPRTGAELEQAYAGADALVLASRAETYGMVITEALARGLPVLATAVGGVPEALGHTARGDRPGLLVRPADPDALAAALRDWLLDAELRRSLRQAALERRSALPGWDATAERFSQLLTGMPA